MDQRPATRGKVEPFRSKGSENPHGKKRVCCMKLLKIGDDILDMEKLCVLKTLPEDEGFNSLPFSLVFIFDMGKECTFHYSTEEERAEILKRVLFLWQCQSQGLFSLERITCPDGFVC
jgi:hypothetical protein